MLSECFYVTACTEIRGLLIEGQYSIPKLEPTTTDPSDVIVYPDYDGPKLWIFQSGSCSSHQSAKQQVNTTSKYLSRKWRLNN